MLALQLAHIPCITQSPILGKGIVPTYTPAAFKLSVCGPPLPGGRLSQSQPEWMDPSPQVLGIRHVTAKLSPTSSHILYVQVILLVHQLGRITRSSRIRLSCQEVMTRNTAPQRLRLVLSHTARDPDPPVWRPRCSQGGDTASMLPVDVQAKLYLATGISDGQRGIGMLQGTRNLLPGPISRTRLQSRTQLAYRSGTLYGTRNIAMSTLNSVRGPTPADANPSTRGLRWIRAHTA